MAGDVHGAQRRSRAFQVQENLRVGVFFCNFVGNFQSQGGFTDPAHAGQPADGRAFVGFKVFEQVLNDIFTPGEVRGRLRKLVERAKYRFSTRGVSRWESKTSTLRRTSELRTSANPRNFSRNFSVSDHKLFGQDAHI